MKGKLTFTVVLILTSLVASSWGQVGLGQSRELAMANGNLALRASPPKGLFYWPGSEVGNISKGDKLVVEDHKAVETLFGTQEWLKVRRVPKGAETPAEPLTGWVYNGIVRLPDGTFKPYIETVPSER